MATRLGCEMEVVTALKAFLDKTSIAAGTQPLWSKIEHGLRNSQWLILMASEAAAIRDDESENWVDRELAWWLEHRDVNRILLLIASAAALSLRSNPLCARARRA